MTGFSKGQCLGGQDGVLNPSAGGYPERNKIQEKFEKIQKSLTNEN